MTDWRDASKEIPAEGAQALISTFQEDAEGRFNGGKYLGGVKGGRWYYESGLRDVPLDSVGFHVDWWAPIDDTPTEADKKGEGPNQ